ncbi:transposable element Tc1 transposase [Trichonephila clavipes]|nr:transposable element Tc1 transposase [Trichonephila clavipes]
MRTFVVGTSTCPLINGRLFSLHINPCLSSQAIVGVFSFGEKQELVFINDISVKKNACESDSVVLGWYLFGWTYRPPFLFPWKNVNAHIYRNDILNAFVRPCALPIGDAFELQDDNARSNRARIVDTYLEQETIQRMQGLARSPDLNPIENVYSRMTCSYSQPRS